MSPTLILALCFVITLAIGVPVVWSLALSSMVAYLSIPGISLSFLAQKMELGSEQYSLLAIFFFMLAGAVMQHGGIATRLIAFAKAITGSVRGGLSIVAIVACMFFAALSGSSVATTAAIGAIMYPELLKDGYDEGYAAALPVVGGTLGIVIPPSIVFVVYGTTTNTSVAKLLMSGVLPGVLAGVAMCVYCYFYAVRHNIHSGGHFSARELLISTKDAIWALLMPLIVLGGIYAGVFTPTESAAVACIYGLIVSCVIYRELRMQKLIQIAIDSVKSTANVMLIIMAAKLFSYVLTRNGIPAMLSNALTEMISTKVMFLLALNILLLFLGMIMDAGPIILIIADHLPCGIEFWHRSHPTGLHHRFQSLCGPGNPALWPMPFCRATSHRAKYCDPQPKIYAIRTDPLCDGIADIVRPCAFHGDSQPNVTTGGGPCSWFSIQLSKMV